MFVKGISMKTRIMKNIFTLFLIVAVTSINAQEITYKVLAVKGKNAIEKAVKPGNYTPLYTGMKLNANDKILLGDGGYLGLAGSNGKTVELKDKGMYNVSELSSNSAADNSSLAMRYVEHIFSDLQADAAATSNTSITGSVERSTSSAAVDVMCPNNTKILLQQTQISWDSKENIEEYHIAVSNFFDEEIFGMDTKDKNAVIDFSAMNLNLQEAYKLTVVKKGASLESGEQIVLKFPNEEEAKAAQSVNADEASAIQNLVSASYMENNGFYLNSTSMYQKASVLEPSVEDFKKEYEEYLERIGSGK